MTSAARVTAVVVTYDHRELLRRCLLALLGQTHPLASILVIDNASSDGTQAMLATDFPGVATVRTARNLGGAGGFELGMRIAVERGCSHAWTMDDDAIPATGALAALLAAADLVGEYAFVASCVHDDDGAVVNTPLLSDRARPGCFPNWPRFLDQGIVEVLQASFVSLLVPAERIRAVGLPIGEYFLWFDDSEYTRRLSNIAPGYLVGASRVFHARARLLDLVGETNERRVPLYYYYYRNHVHMLLLHRSARSFRYLVMHHLLAARDVLRCLLRFAPLRALVIVRGLLGGWWLFVRIHDLPARAELWRRSLPAPPLDSPGSSGEPG